MTTYGVGAAARLTTEVRDPSGALVDAATVSLTIQLPDGTTVGPFTAPDVAHDGTGLYHYDYTTTMAGRHIARWSSTTPATVNEDTFDVAAQWADAGIISLDDAKKHLNGVAVDDDEELKGFIRSVTVICERYVGSLVRTTYVETHRGGYAIALDHPPVLSVTSVVAIQIGGIDQAVADLDVDGPTGIIRRLDRRRMRGPFRVTYVAGRPDVQPHVRQAGLIILEHLWETQRGTAVPRFGADEQWDPRWSYAIPRRALELLGGQIPGIA